jgi:GH15 family glucan-1,4-alpha-glucosidase
MDLTQRSIEIILHNQSSTGAYVASPAFPSYAYCWLRDGSYIAYAMDICGKHESARAFHNWAASVIQRYEWKIDRIVRNRLGGVPLNKTDFLHTRYTLDGMEASADWWNFQLDGYGTWLWALAEHAKLANSRAMIETLGSSIAGVTRYLLEVWEVPNYDCWEEFPEFQHPYTLASTYGGLKAISTISESTDHMTLGLAKIRAFVQKHCVHNGRLVKQISPTGSQEALMGVDASLIGVSLPYGLLAPDDQIMKETIAEIERSLVSKHGGVYRYAEDTYYGGGEWLLLTAWLGWYYARLGQRSKAEELAKWIEAQTDADGLLPEQVSGQQLHPDSYEEWHNRWGPIAKPLLWSHAMYLILRAELLRTGDAP